MTPATSVGICVFDLASHGGPGACWSRLVQDGRVRVHASTHCRRISRFLSTSHWAQGCWLGGAAQRWTCGPTDIRTCRLLHLYGVFGTRMGERGCKQAVGRKERACLAMEDNRHIGWARRGSWFGLMTWDGAGWCAARSDGLSNSRFSGREMGWKKAEALTECLSCER